jgi:GDPmannose 4,6-dehydratase
VIVWSIVKELDKKKLALITGIAGQDGSYLAEFLLDKNYEVHGVIADYHYQDRSRLWRLKSLEGRIRLHVIDVLNFQQTENCISKLRPDEIYHLASNVEPRVIFEDEINTYNINFTGTINLLRAIHKTRVNSKLYCAGSSLMFGKVTESPQNEDSSMNPTTPYGIAKVAALHFIRMYREAYGVFACMGILYNHESPRRDDRFLPRKITKAVASIKAGKQSTLELGNINIQRDWSFAGDVIESMWLMLQAEKPRDYVVGSGVLHSIEELLAVAFGAVGLDWRKYVVMNDKFFRNIDYENLCADISKAKMELNWSPRVNFEQLILNMVEADMKLLKGSCD